MPEIFVAPRFTDVLRYEISDKETILWLQGADGKKYRAEFDVNAVGAIIDALQMHLTTDRGGPLLTLTPTAISSVATPERKGLRLRTKEAGAIALDLDDRAIHQLQVAVGELASIQIPDKPQ